MRTPDLLCVALVAGCAKTTPVTPMAEATPERVVESIAVPADDGQGRELYLWEVRKGGSVNYLMGTCHLPIPLERNLPPPYLAALDGARVLYVETSLSDLNQADMLRATLAEPGHSNRELLGDEWARAIAPYAGKLPAPLLDRLHPWAMYVTLQAADGANITDREGLASEILDVQVINRAKGNGTPVGYLEDIQDQLDLFTNMPQDDLLDLMRPSSDSYTDSRVMASDLLSGCWSSNIAAAQATVDKMGEDPSSEAFLWRRNDLWMEVLPGEFEQGNAFVAVGTGHMFGDRGLLSQLEASGFSITARTSASALPELPAAAEALIAVKPAPPEVTLDQVAVDRWAETVQAGVAAMCSVESSPLRTCTTASAEVCEAEVRYATRLCVEQEGGALPPADGKMEPTQNQQIAACAVGTAAMLAYLDHGPSADSCPMNAMLGGGTK